MTTQNKKFRDPTFAWFCCRNATRQCQSRWRRWRRSAGSLAVVFLLPLLLSAHAAVAEMPAALKAADTSSPRATLRTLIDNVTAAHQVLQVARFVNRTEGGLFMSDEVIAKVEEARDILARAVKTLDLSEVPPVGLSRLAKVKVVLFKEVLDRISLPPESAIPGSDAVRDDKILRWRLPGTEIVLIKMPDGPRAGEFLFSAATVAQINTFYRKVRHLPYQTTTTKGLFERLASQPGGLLAPKWLQWVQYLPPWAKSHYYEHTLWQWVGMAIASLLVVMIPCLAVRWLRRCPQPDGLHWRAWRRAILPIVIMCNFLLFRYLAADVVNMTGFVFDVVVKVLATLFYFTAAWLAFIVTSVIVESIIASPRIDPKSLDANMLRVLFRILGSAAAISLVLFGAGRIGIPVIPLLAGLGVGGLALALAAQPTIENLIGGIMLYTDRPVRVGELCSFGNLTGRVEYIGLRSTRIRAIDRKLISVPNADFAKMSLVNFTRRDRMLLRTTIGLRYETTPEQLRHVLAKLREMLIAHPRINPAPMRVRFVGFAAYSLNVQIHAFANTRLFPEFSAIREDVYLRVIDIVKASGTGFAFPSQTTYFARDGGIDGERGTEVEEQVQRWREAGELPFPDYSGDQKAEIKDTLDYPPEGSALTPQPESDTPKSN